MTMAANGGTGTFNYVSLQKADPPPSGTGIAQIDTSTAASPTVIGMTVTSQGSGLTAVITDNIAGITKKFRMDLMGVYTNSPVIYATKVIEGIYDETTVISSLTFALSYDSSTWSNGSIIVWGSTS